LLARPDEYNKPSQAARAPRFFALHPLAAWLIARASAPIVGRRPRLVLRGGAVAALFVAPSAARWSTHVPVMLLRQAFALCLCAIAVRILVRP